MMNNNSNCAFTICTRSYIGLAKSLMNSFLKHNEGFDFRIIISDYNKEYQDNESIVDSRLATGLDDAKYLELAFKYSLTEFCTAIKPFCFNYLFDLGYQKVIYLDPDILFFSRFNEIYGDYSVYLIPHVLKIFPKDSGGEFWQKETFLKYGVFNCGFVGLSNDKIGKDITKWWMSELVDKAYDDIDNGYYTDQKWMDLIPSLVPVNRILIVKNSGCDLAPWNYFERKVQYEDGTYFVEDRDKDDVIIRSHLCFAHYSAYSYKDLIKNSKIVSRYMMNHYEDIDPLLWKYREALIDNNAGQFLDIKYAFDYYDNGQIISQFNRRLFRSLIEKGERYDNPFSVSENSFYSIMKRNKLLTKKNKGKILFNDIGEKEIYTKGKIIEALFGCCKVFIGIDNYDLLLRKIKKISRAENNGFLIKTNTHRKYKS